LSPYHHNLGFPDNHYLPAPVQRDMPVPSSAVHAALVAIHDAELAHPGGELLDCFVSEAVDKEQAANYLLQRCSGKHGPGLLAAFLSDWTQLISACKRDAGNVSLPLLLTSQSISIR
jgi:hypothetical protein